MTGESKPAPARQESGAAKSLLGLHHFRRGGRRVRFAQRDPIGQRPQADRDAGIDQAHQAAAERLGRARRTCRLCSPSRAPTLMSAISSIEHSGQESTTISTRSRCPTREEGDFEVGDVDDEFAVGPDHCRSRHRSPATNGSELRLSPPWRRELLAQVVPLLWGEELEGAGRSSSGGSGLPVFVVEALDGKLSQSAGLFDRLQQQRRHPLGGKRHPTKVEGQQAQGQSDDKRRRQQDGCGPSGEMGGNLSCHSPTVGDFRMAMARRPGKAARINPAPISAEPIQKRGPSALPKENGPERDADDRLQRRRAARPVRPPGAPATDSTGTWPERSTPAQGRERPGRPGRVIGPAGPPPSQPPPAAGSEVAHPGRRRN